MRDVLPIASHDAGHHWNGENQRKSNIRVRNTRVSHVVARAALVLPDLQHLAELHAALTVVAEGAGLATKVIQEVRFHIVVPLESLKSEF